MCSVNLYKGLIILVFACLTTTALAKGPGDGELAMRLAGNTFSGIYIRAGTTYTMQFASDGSLTDSAGRNGSWWVNEDERYCRVWQNGPMAGLETCMEVVIHNQRIAFFSRDDLVLQGELRGQ